MAWRRGNSGYSGGCVQNDISNQVISDSFGDEWCDLMVGGYCGNLSSRYIVTDIEDQLATSDNYCYGYEEIDFAKPIGPYQVAWTDCCWVDFTSDTNTNVEGDTYGLVASIYNPNNNTPTVKLPALWKIMAGCDGQTLDLNPVDLDSNKIKCRWSTQAEGHSAHDGVGNFNSISLDEETCILTYDGSQDLAPYGLKPVAIQIEDFETDGTILSSTPIQFLATVWTPSNLNSRLLGQYGPGKPFSYSAIFPEDHHNHKTDDTTRGRRQATAPAYCNDKPVLVAPSPAAGIVIAVSSAGVTINVAATSGGFRTMYHCL